MPVKSNKQPISTRFSSMRSPKVGRLEPCRSESFPAGLSHGRIAESSFGQLRIRESLSFARVAGGVPGRLDYAAELSGRHKLHRVKHLCRRVASTKNVTLP